ncbi:MAG: mercury transporter MerT [Rhizobiales bacterium]|nr:mercury transporter MerT [Hyphomicrobiales bacterium]
MNKIINTTDGKQSGAIKTKLIATGGILGAIAASTCCIVPLVLFSLGISGAWIGTLTALSPYKPIFIIITVGFLGYGYYRVYGLSKTTCEDGTVCTKPLPNKLVKTALWFSTILVIIAFAWPVIIPYLAPYIFG